MSSDNQGESEQALPTAVIANDPNFQYQAMVDRDTDEVTLVLVNPAGTKFALKFDIATAVLLSRLCGKVLGGWHHQHKDGMLGYDVAEASVGTLEGKRNHISIQFELGCAYMIDDETALKLAELIETHVLAHMPENVKHKRLAKKHPSIILPRPTVLKP